MIHKCYICGESMFTQKHHILPRSKGGSDNQENLIVLCANCHAGAHHGMYTQDELIDLKHEVESGRLKIKSKVIKAPIDPYTSVVDILLKDTLK